MTRPICVCQAKADAAQHQQVAAVWQHRRCNVLSPLLVLVRTWWHDACLSYSSKLGCNSNQASRHRCHVQTRALLNICTVIHRKLQSFGVLSSTQEWDMHVSMKLKHFPLMVRVLLCRNRGLMHHHLTLAASDVQGKANCLSACLLRCMRTSRACIQSTSQRIWHAACKGPSILLGTALLCMHSAV